jgi:hypothetical protein
MTANKADFFNDLSSHISDTIYLTDRTDEVDLEIKHNYWAFVAPIEIVAQTTTCDLLEFIKKVKYNYNNQLNKSKLNIDLIFYLWFDEMSGQLCFNFINSNHDRLPFRCKLKYTVGQEEIVDEYLKSKYHRQVIPWNELQAIETPEEIAEPDLLEKDLYDNFILKVYKEKIIKQK